MCYIISTTERHISVKDWNPTTGTVNRVPIVCTILCYNIPNSDWYYFLICWNTLYVPELDHRLIPPHIICEAGIYINDVQEQYTKTQSLPSQYNVDRSLSDSPETQGVVLVLWSSSLYYWTTWKYHQRKYDLNYSNAPKWDPDAPWFEAEELTFVSEDGTFFGNDGKMVPSTGDDNPHCLIDDNDFTDK